jgi:hypothetical protein
VARLLLSDRRMKALVTVAFIALTAPAARAQPVAPSPAPPAAPSISPPLSFQLDVSTGTARRTYHLQLADSCGGIEDKSPDWTARIRVCAHATPQGIRLKLDGRVHASNVEYWTDLESTIRRGAKIDVGRDGGVRFTLSAS